MLKNYFKIGIRNLIRNKVHSVINILGLSIGLASFLLISLFVIDERSYDKHFPDSSNIYRVVLNGVIAGNPLTIPFVPAPLAQAMKDEFPELRDAVRMRGTTLGGDPISVKIEDQFYEENGIIFADANIISFFDIQLISGNPKTALQEPNSLLITPQLAQKYFKSENAIGKTIHMVDMERDFVVTGIVKPLPQNSHFKFAMIVSLISDENSRSTRWIGGQLMTYIKLNNQPDIKRVNDDLERIVLKYVAPQMKDFMGIPFDQFLSEGGVYRYYLQPLLDIHLKSNLDTEWEINGSASYVNILGLVGILILLIAGINFTNSSASLSTTRSKEIGIRKVMGSDKNQLALQFIIESIMISILALLISIVFIIVLMGQFNQVANKSIEILDLLTPANSLLVITITVCVGILSGLYPAFYISKFNPIKALSGQLKTGKSSRVFRNGLVVVQFIISSTLIISTLFIREQLDYFRNKDLGFDKTQIVILKNADILKQREVVINELLQESNIKGASFSSAIPGKKIGRAAYQPDDFTETFVFPVMSVDQHFAGVYGIPLYSGRTFSEGGLNEFLGVMINQSAAKDIGWEDPIGKSFNGQMMDAKALQVIGVVNDFNFQSLHTKIDPLIMEYPRPEDKLNFLSIKVSGQTESALDAIRKTWQNFAPGRVFDYEFFDKTYENLYQNDQRLGSLIQIFSMIAIFVACIGLFGLMYHNANRSIKEVAIRKVLGSSSMEIIVLFNKRLLLLISISVVVAPLLTYWLVSNWLANFAFRIQVNLWPFILGISLTLIIAMASVAYVIIRAALTNPTTVLRNNN